MTERCYLRGHSVGAGTMKRNYPEVKLVFGHVESYSIAGKGMCGRSGEHIVGT